MKSFTYMLLAQIKILLAVQIFSQWESQKNRFAFISFGKIQFLPPCIWNLPFMSYGTASGITKLYNLYTKQSILFLAPDTYRYYRY